MDNLCPNMVAHNMILEPISARNREWDILHRLNSNKLDEFYNKHGRLNSNSVGVLNNINKAYQEFIEDVEKNNKYIIKCSNKDKFTAEHSTSLNILKRRNDVAKKLLQVKEDNKRLKSLITSKQMEGNKLKINWKYEFKSDVTPSDNDEMSVDIDVLGGSMKFSRSLYYAKSWHTESTLDVAKLQEKSKELQCNLKCLQLSLVSKFERKEKYREQRDYLLQQEKAKEGLVNYNEELKDIILERGQKIQILKGELSEHYPNEKPGLKSTKLSDPLLPLLKGKKVDSDEPDDHKYINSCIKYINIFNDQFQQQNYKIAARLAANSPDGILRNYNTFLQFKNACNNKTSKTTPAFLFCEALINTSYNDGVVCDNLSIEIIRCATFQNDKNLLQYWLHNVIIKWSKSIGDLIIECCKCVYKCQCGWTSLALQVYSHLQLYKGIILCHLKFFNFNYVIKYMEHYDFSPGEFKELIADYPQIQFSYLWSDVTAEKPYVSLPGIISVFLHQKMNDSIINVLNDVYTKGLHGESLLGCLLKETVYDDMGEEKWASVLNICKYSDHFELAEELYSSLITRYCLNNATIFCLRDYIS